MSGNQKNLPAALQEQMEKAVPLAVELRNRLHTMPELSRQEVKSKQALMDFFRTNLPEQKLIDCDHFFYTVHREEGAKETVLFRADFDAIPDPDGHPFHGCGHDGHAATLAGSALAILRYCAAGHKLGRNIVFLFQHAEEDGTGALDCLPVIDKEGVQAIYGLHNMPGIPLGTLTSKPGSFQCASRGLQIRVLGLQAHASEPEKGHNPVYLLSLLATAMKPLAEFRGYGPFELPELGLKFSGLTLCTIVYMRVGDDGRYGVSPGKGQIQVTLRASADDDLNKLEKWVRDRMTETAKEEGFELAFSNSDVFPDTTNDPRCFDALEKAFETAKLPFFRLQDPLRASEDFGHYLKHKPGCYFFLGSGENCVNLHNPEYQFPNEVLSHGVDAFAALAVYQGALT